MHNNENWDDLRYVLAVAETGSVSAAARRLGVNHATVLRRISALEDRQGIEIFAKNSRGYDVPDDRTHIIAAAKEIESAFQSLDRVIKGTQSPLGGFVRVTSTDTFCQTVLPGIVSKMQLPEHDLHVEVIASNAHLDLSRLHADIAVRPTIALDPDLSGEIACQLGFDVYAKPGSAHNRWIGPSGRIAQTVVSSWIDDQIPTNEVKATCDSFITMRELARHDVGQAVLPCILGDSDPGLERRSQIGPKTSVNIWVASHSDIYDAPHIRAVRGMLVTALRAHAPALLGHDVPID